MPSQIHGILLLDKPINVTSNHVLQKVKRLFGAKKAGHTGSLDPIATGMLPICFGEATKFSQYLLNSDKTYYVTATLGIQTTTGDCEGEILAQKPVGVNEADVHAVFQTFIGEISQIPPMYSAIKHKGQPLYELARKGISIEREPRLIKIYALHFHELHGNQLIFTVRCSKGTYVRTLVEDIAVKLGTLAHVTALRRLSVVPYENHKMYSFDALISLANSGSQDLLPCLLNVETSVQTYPEVKLSNAALFYLRMGQAVRTNLPAQTTLVRLISEDARFLGMGEVLMDGRVKPHRLLAQ